MPWGVAPRARTVTGVRTNYSATCLAPWCVRLRAPCSVSSSTLRRQLPAPWCVSSEHLGASVPSTLHRQCPAPWCVSSEHSRERQVLSCPRLNAVDRSVNDLDQLHGRNDVAGVVEAVRDLQQAARVARDMAGVVVACRSRTASSRRRCARALTLKSRTVAPARSISLARNSGFRLATA